MPRENEARLSGATVPGFKPMSPELAPGSYCTTTHRLVVISPYPFKLRELIGELTTRCYDVMVFHHLDEEALSRLPIDLLVMDRTHDAQFSVAPAAPRLLQAIPTLLLLNERFIEFAESAVGQTKASAMWWSAELAGEAVERIESLLRHSRPSGERADQFVWKDLLVDNKRISVHIGDTRIDLTKTEFDLLKTLLEAGGKVLSRQEMMDRVWGEQYFGGSNTVDVHVKSLRQKLKDSPRTPKYIETIRGVGYRLAD